MAYRSKTLRRMSPTARKLARLNGELESVSRRIKNALPDIQQLEIDSEALHNHKCKLDAVAMIVVTKNESDEDIDWSRIADSIAEGYTEGIDQPDIGICWYLVEQ